MTGKSRWLALLAVLGLAVPVTMAQQPTSPLGADVIALLDKHDEAMKQKDLNAVMALYAPGPTTVMIGTGPGERWVGKDEIRSAYVEFFKDYDKGSLARRCDWKTGEVKSDLAWGAAMCSLTDARQDRKRTYDLNVTAVAARQDGQWLFRAMHFSNLTAPDPRPPGK